MSAPKQALAFPTAPILSAYWVQTGLLAGAYPSVRYNTSLSRERIARLLGAGVRAFLDLTEEGERDPYLPLARSEAANRGHDLRHERMPIPDYHVPTREEMRAILDTLDAALAGGHTVYLHCWGGVGRTGTVVGCYLVRHGMDGESALRELARLRRNALCSEMPSPETNEQRAFVREWSEER